MTARPKASRTGKKKPAGKAKPKIRRSKKAKNTKPKTWRWLGILLGAAATALVLTWLLLPGLSSKPKPARGKAVEAPKASITYEEPSSPPVERDQLQKLYEAVFDSLHNAGARQEQIISRLAHNNGDAWWVHSVNLGKNQNGERMAGLIRQSLANSPSAHLSLGKAGRITTLTISLNGRKEHVIWLVPPSSEQARPVQPPPPPGTAQKPGGRKPLAAIVIDDLGYQMKPARGLLKLDLPLTFSILPHGPHSAEIARQALAQGREVLLHLPMEPRSYPRINPGPGALLVDMPADKLKRLVRDNLALVPGATGVNNHMGSRFTESQASLKPVFEELGQRGLFFLDSYTSPKSKALGLARKMGLPSVRRDVFLDHQVSSKAITLQLERLLFLARRKKTVIAIGHPHPETIAALKSYASRLRKELNLAPVSQVLAARLGSKAKKKASAD